jgi:3-hydroxyisobutyrate dehydrogenase-like beta-hydroxyacid dehydrogenase
MHASDTALLAFRAVRYNAAVATVGILHPGEMGAAVAAALAGAGHEVLWAPAGRSAATRARAREAGLADAGDPAALAGRSDVVLSICPPHAALGVARAVAGFAGVYVDANAVAPATARAVAAVVQAGGATYVDGGIIGPPPRVTGDARLYLSGGPAAHAVAGLFAGTVVEAPVLSGDPVAASALKMAYAAWTKGTHALLLAIRAAARELGVEDALAAEWARSQPELPGRSGRAAAAAAAKGWRWDGEMEQVADTLAAAGLPDGFHRAAAEVFRRVPPGLAADDPRLLDDLLRALARGV